MPCRLCEVFKPCEMTTDEIIQYLKKDNEPKKSFKNSLVVAKNMKNNCPCKECIVNSKCGNGLTCVQFREQSFFGVSIELKRQIANLVLEDIKV